MILNTYNFFLNNLYKGYLLILSVIFKCFHMILTRNIICKLHLIAIILFSDNI